MSAPTRSPTGGVTGSTLSESTAHAGHELASGENDWTELADRATDGLRITLSWSGATGRVKVAVADARQGEQFEFDVAGADALSAFHHPFAFAPDRGLRPTVAPRMSIDAQPQG